jgi:hypothetical protein
VLAFKKEFESSLKAVTQDPSLTSKKNHNEWRGVPLKAVTQDPSLKAFVFKCQKAIFTPVNHPHQSSISVSFKIGLLAT